MIIGLLGLAGAGKDTTGLILQEVLAEMGMNFVIDRYAAPLKIAAAKVFGDKFDERENKENPVRINPDHALQATFECCTQLRFTDEELDKASAFYDTHLGLKDVLSPREYQQLLGTEVVRAVRPTAWRDRLAARKKNIIVTDTRFLNELCETNLLITRFENIDRPKHPSEQLAWDLQFTGKRLPVDIININNRRPTTLEELEANVREAVNYITFNGVY